jgi:hypothetical protein
VQFQWSQGRLDRWQHQHQHPSHHYPHHPHQHGGRLITLIKMVPTASDHPNSTLEPTYYLLSRACQDKADRRHRRAAALALPASKLVALLPAISSLVWSGGAWLVRSHHGRGGCGVIVHVLEPQSGCQAARYGAVVGSKQLFNTRCAMRPNLGMAGGEWYPPPRAWRLLSSPGGAQPP